MGKPALLLAKSSGWSEEAMSLVAHAKVLSGSKLEQLVVRIQRHSGRPKQECWRFVIQHGLKESVDYRRWTEEEIDFVREELVKLSIEEIAKKIDRTPKAIRNMLRRNQLSVREIRCDLLSVESLACALHVRKSEVVFWIEQNWLKATMVTTGRRRFYSITPEALKELYKYHYRELLQRGMRNLALFEAYVEYCFAPKHTVGEQLLEVRRDKRERAAFAMAADDFPDEEEDNDDDDEEMDRQFHAELAELGSCPDSEDHDA